MPTPRSRVLRRDWAGSWSSPKTTRCPTAGCTSWSSTRTGRRSSRCRRWRSPGWTWQTPASAGPIVWGLGDKGGYEAFARGRLYEQGAVSLGGPADGRCGIDRAGLRAWRGRTASSGWLRGIPDDTSSTPSTARSSPRRRRSAGPGAGTDPDGGQARDHDISGSSDRRRRALGNRSRDERRRLEDGRRRALAR